jgi:putative N6-adenine-specific DNA methylase
LWNENKINLFLPTFIILKQIKALLLQPMSLFTIAAPITITCNKRLAPYLEHEVRELGFEVEETFITGVRLHGTINDCIRLNLNLRCASQVLFSLDSFEAHHPDDIYNNLLELAWEDLLPRSRIFFCNQQCTARYY